MGVPMVLALLFLVSLIAGDLLHLVVLGERGYRDGDREGLPLRGLPKWRSGV